MACFISKMINHQVENCPVRKKPHHVAKLFGSAAPGLEFHQLEISDVNAQHIGTSRNIGVVYIEAGKITKAQLAKEFSSIYETSWPWQIRQLDDYSFLVKFPQRSRWIGRQDTQALVYPLKVSLSTLRLGMGSLITLRSFKKSGCNFRG